jgi:hypothetical protein
MDIKDTDRPWQIFGVLDGAEGFHSGHLEKGGAEHVLADVNKRAAEMGIKTRYILKDCTPKAAPVEAPTNVPDVGVDGSVVPVGLGGPVI